MDQSDFAENPPTLQLFCKSSQPIGGRMDRASAIETVYTCLIPGRVNPKTIKIGIRSFSACRSGF